MTQVQRDLLIFIAIPVAYSIGFFGWCYLAEKMPVFSKRNARSSASVICGHVTVLLFVILLAQMAIQFYPSLPGWLTDQTIHARGPHSIFELLCVVGTLLIGWAEKRWIYIDSGMDRSEADNDHA